MVHEGGGGLKVQNTVPMVYGRPQKKDSVMLQRALEKHLLLLSIQIQHKDINPLVFWMIKNLYFKVNVFKVKI